MPPKVDKAKDSGTSDEEEYDTLVQPHISAKEMCFMRLQALYQISKNVRDKPELLGDFNARFSELPSWRDKYEQCILNITVLKKRFVPTYVPSYRELESFDEIYFFICGVSNSLNDTTKIRTEI